MKRRTWCAALAALAGLGLAGQAAQAEIKVGVVLSLTGAGASLGIPEKNTVELLTATLGGQAVRYIVLDDATDTANATKHARRLIEEEKVDLILGPSVTPTSLAVVEVAGPASTPVVSLAGSGAIVLPPEICDRPLALAVIYRPRPSIDADALVTSLRHGVAQLLGQELAAARRRRR